MDGTFVFGVLTTGIYCRPSCPARRPRPEHLRYFHTRVEAEREGFRPCLRCGSGDRTSILVGKVCRLLDSGTSSLRELGRSLGASPFHLARTFKRLTGITPRQFAQALRRRRFKDALRRGDGVLDSLAGADMNSTSRVYGATSQMPGMTPGQYRRGGSRLEIDYAVVRCPLGRLLVARTARGICDVALGSTVRELEATLARDYPNASRRRETKRLRAAVIALLRHLEGRQPRLDLPVDVRATAFQERVWSELRSIPYGQTRSYEQLARAVGRPAAARAVARACARNRVALIVPCHRIVRKDGSPGGYRWGIQRKIALLKRERSGRSTSPREIPSRGG